MGVSDVSVIEKLKAQRDRFIAFAFAGADLLLEVGENDVITYSAGAGEALYGLSDSDLTHKRLGDFIHSKDRKRFDDAVLRLKNTGRLDHVQLTLVGATGTVARLRMAGIRLPQFPKCYHLVLSRIPALAITDPEHASAAVDDKAKFVAMVQQRLNEANRIGQDYTLTLFDLSESNFDGIEAAAAQGFMSTVLHTLEECSVRGNSAGPLSDRAFGLIHDENISAETVLKRVTALAGKFTGKSGKSAAIKMRSSTLEMEDSALSEEDIAKAMTYIVNGFVRDSAKFAMKSLADGARMAVEETLVRVRNFRKMVKGEDKLAFLFQPVVNLRTGAVLKYEAFCRITHNGGFFLPSQIIPFATDVGLISEFDLMTITKALKMLRNPTEISALAIIAVNVSGQSLGNPAFYQFLFRLLEDNRQVLGRLVIEVTDAVSIYNLDEAKRLMTRIRKLGARISLDDFGSGGSAFDLLRMLPVDFAKIDACYIQDARSSAKGKAVLKAITGLCTDLGIITIGECVEDVATMILLREMNVDYAQGYYFAAPALDGAKRIKYFTEHIKPIADA